MYYARQKTNLGVTDAQVPGLVSSSTNALTSILNLFRPAPKTDQGPTPNQLIRISQAQQAQQGSQTRNLILLGLGGIAVLGAVMYFTRK